VNTGAFVIAVLFLLAMIAVPGAIDHARGESGGACTYHRGDGSTYRAPCPEQLPSGND
jgi:hypothetical protein